MRSGISTPKPPMVPLSEFTTRFGQGRPGCSMIQRSGALLAAGLVHTRCHSLKKESTTQPEVMRSASRTPNCSHELAVQIDVLDGNSLHPTECAERCEVLVGPPPLKIMIPQYPDGLLDGPVEDVMA